MSDPLIAFIEESNRIEGIHRAPTEVEVEAHRELLRLSTITVEDLERFVEAVAGARLRVNAGDDVYVGNHKPPPGGPDIRFKLQYLLVGLKLSEGLTPYEVHQRYELLHPFMDGNGRSGRALWAWHMQRQGQDPFALPFLHGWYYQSLDAARDLSNGY